MGLRCDTQAAPSPPACGCPAATPGCERLRLIPIWPLAVASGAVGLLSPVAPIANLSLGAQLRFFFPSHPDFEGAVLLQCRGIPKQPSARTCWDRGQLPAGAPST